MLFATDLKLLLSRVNKKWGNLRMQVKENVSLRGFNTFGIDVTAKRMAIITNPADLLHHAFESPMLVLGGGSNILFTKNFNGWVLKNEIRGIDLLHEDADHVYVRAGAGENWHAFVMYCVERNWAGIENLALIPGRVGASPIQNIGAYGVELADVFHSLEAFHLDEKKIMTFTGVDCQFGYRDSIFKNAYRGKVIILNVTFRLKKTPVFHTGYGALQQELQKMNVTTVSIAAIAEAVIRIRQSKLPDPAVIGNAGSFFKNPEIDPEQFARLKNEQPNIAAYPLVNGRVKLAAGWLIEQCGWKGYRKGDAGVHAQQALVLVNYGNATGEDILSLSKEVADSVKTKFGVELEREVNLV